MLCRLVSVEQLEENNVICLRSPAIAPPNMPRTGALAFDLSRLTDSWAFMYMFPIHTPNAATTIAGAANTGAYTITEIALLDMAMVVSTEN